MEASQPKSSLEQEAINETTASDRLCELARINFKLARLVANNPSAPAEILQELSASKDATIRRYVAANPNTPTEILLRLCPEFPQQFLHNAVFPLLLLENPNLVNEMPLPTLQSILVQESVPVFLLEWAADRFAHNWWSYDVLKVLLAVVNNPSTPGIALAKLAEHQDDEVRWCVAFHPNTPENALEKLARDSRLRIRYSVAQNTSTPTQILTDLARDKSHSIRVAVALNPATPKKILEQLARDSENRVREAVAESFNLPIGVR